MNRKLIKSISTDSEVYENLLIDDFVVPLLVLSPNGVYLCMTDSTDTNFDLQLFDKVKKKFALPDVYYYLFKFSDDATGQFCIGEQDFQQADNIYDVYKICYDFAAIYFAGKADTDITLLLEGIGA